MKTLKTLQILGLKQLQNSASVKKGTSASFFGNLLSTFMQNGQNRSKLPGMPVFGTRILVKNQPVKQQQVINDQKPAIRPKSEKVQSLQSYTSLLGKSGKSTAVKSNTSQINSEMEQGILTTLYSVQASSLTDQKQMFKQPVKISETVFAQTKLKAGDTVIKFSVKDNSQLKQVTNFINGIKQKAAAQKIKLPEMEVAIQTKITAKSSALSTSSQKIKVNTKNSLNAENSVLGKKATQGQGQSATTQKTKGIPEPILSAKQLQKNNLLNDSIKLENNTGKIKEPSAKLNVPIGTAKTTIKDNAHLTSSQKIKVNTKNFLNAENSAFGKKATQSQGQSATTPKTKGIPEPIHSAKQSQKKNIINDSVKAENTSGKNKEVYPDFSVPVKKGKSTPEGKRLVPSPDNKTQLVSDKIKDGSITVKKSVETGKVFQPEFKKEISRTANHSAKSQPVPKTGTIEKNEISTRTEVDKNLDLGSAKKATEIHSGVKEVKEEIQLHSQKSKLHPFGARTEEINEAKKGRSKSKNAQQTLKQSSEIEKPVAQEYHRKPNIRQTASKGFDKTEAQSDLNKTSTVQQTADVKAPNLQPETGLHQQIPEIKAMEVPEKFQSMVSRIREIIEKFENPAKHSTTKTSFKISGSPAGQMEINLAEKENSKKIKIVVETESIRNELQKALPQIQQNLSAKGIEFNAFTIEVANFGSKMGLAQDTQRNMQHDKSKQRKEAQDEQEQSPIKQKNYGYNTIEIVA